MTPVSQHFTTRDSVLRLDGFGAGFGDRVILAEIDLEVPDNGLMALMGPTGVGKSTLLRTVCGAAQQNASFKSWGEMRYLALVAGEAGWPRLVMQDARLLVSTVYENLVSGLSNRSRLTLPEQRKALTRVLEELDSDRFMGCLEQSVVELSLADQRLIAILRHVLSEPGLLCVDEPTVGLDEAGSRSVLTLLARYAEQRPVLMATHNLAQAGDWADYVALLVSGRIRELAPAETFFTCPETEAGRAFIRQGTCASPSPDITAEVLDEDTPPPPPLPEKAHQAMNAWAGPRGFVWLDPGELAGTPRPGVIHNVEQDLDALARVGVTRLLTLLETPLDCDAALAERGMQSMHIPVDDMTAPTVTQAVTFCRQIWRWIQQGEVVAAHCHAGHGRTGTALAAYRIWQGLAAVEAIESLRAIEPRWIQSREQIEFLERFEKFTQSPEHRPSGEPGYA
ncbi:ATP-binding cassette domain-containing protein [Wenzhouxiangella sp. 15181]|nr:ATP-binding cassette domain-containing protein [Wenzhouxiangella sp. 15181]RFP67288.1 ATP-binding cassette domain-containing protein [Wenzhouxiangella sp. 15190]